MQLMLIAGIVSHRRRRFALQNNSAVVVTLALWNFEGSLARRAAGRRWHRRTDRRAGIDAGGDSRP